MNVLRKLHMLKFLKDRIKGETVNLILPEGIFDFILFVDVRKGAYTWKYGKKYFSRCISEEGKYADFLECMLTRVCGDREEFYESMKLIRVLGALAVQEKYIVICGLKFEDGTYHKKFTFIRNNFYEKSVKQKENIVVFCEDITGFLSDVEAGEKAGAVSGGREDEVDALRERIVYLVHEIRTSLNGIYGNLKMLREETGPKDRYLNNAVLSAEHLLNLVNSALSISELENRGRGTIEAVTLEDLIKYPKGIFAYEAEKRNIGIRFVCGEPVYRYLYLNRTAVQQIMINLISNAVKYTEDGGQITCRMTEAFREEKRVRLLLEISDTGIGMEEKFLTGGWKAYGRERRKKEAQGSGLGLVLTRYLVEKQQGSMRIETESGAGTTVFVEIEADGDDILHEPADGTEKTSAHGEIFMKRALVAEDEDANMEVICGLLEKMGIAADKTYDGDEALEIFGQSEEEYYDVILMDVHMPGKDGIEAVKEIRSMERRDSRMPIIAMTADILDERVRRELSATVNCCLVKPYREEDVHAALLECSKNSPWEPENDIRCPSKRTDRCKNGRIGGTQEERKRSGDSPTESALYFQSAGCGTDNHKDRSGKSL